MHAYRRCVCKLNFLTAGKIHGVDELLMLLLMLHYQTQFSVLDRFELYRKLVATYTSEETFFCMHMRNCVAQKAHINLTQTN